MSFNKSNLSLAVACAALAIPTFLQLRAEAETFVDVVRGQNCSREQNSV